MHQICLGVMRRLLTIWFRGLARVGTTVSGSMTCKVNEKLSKIRRYVPSDFVRKPRSLAELEHWKATEYRQFLLYTGLYVLKGCLSSCYYDHFLTLSVACHILVTPSLAISHLDFARTLLRYFVDCGRVLYGSKFLVYNVHLLLHITDDVATQCCLLFRKLSAEGEEKCSFW